MLVHIKVLNKDDYTNKPTHEKKLFSRANSKGLYQHINAERLVM